MGVSGQLHDPAALPPEREPPVTIGLGGRMAGLWWQAFTKVRQAGRHVNIYFAALGHAHWNPCPRHRKSLDLEVNR